MGRLITRPRLKRKRVVAGEFSDCKGYRRRRKISETTKTTELSMDLIELEILTRLPNKTLLRFKSVCKTWDAFIKDPIFLQTHEKHLNPPSTFSNILLILNAPNNTQKCRLLHFSEIERQPIGIDLPYLSSDFRSCQVVGISNGLLCMSLSSNCLQFVICNPFTGQFRHIPIIMIPWLGRVLLVGFDLKFKGNELIRTIFSKVYENQLLCVQMYNKRTNTWRTCRLKFRQDFDLYRLASLHHDKAITVDGVFYWYVETDEATCVAYYDVRKKVFDLIETPSFDVPAICSKLLQMKGELALIRYDLKNIDLCVLNQDMSWRIEHIDVPTCLARNKKSKRFRLLGFDTNSELIFGSWSRNYLRLLSFDPNSKETKILHNINVAGLAIKNVVLHLESLQPVNLGWN